MLEKDKAIPMTPMCPNSNYTRNSSEHQLEDVVVNEIASRTVWQELKGLAIVHGPLLLVDLKRFKSASWFVAKVSWFCNSPKGHR
jgi:hypothetical protein